MRRFAVLAGLGAIVLGVGCLPGCKRDVVPDNGVTVNTEKPTPAQLVEYLNANARIVQSIKSTKVEMDAKQGNDSIGLEGKLFCQSPRNFRLLAQKPVVDTRAVDIGSNDKEFWYWISEDKDPTDGVARVHFCSYQDMAAGKARMPFPFQPDMIVAALGMREYDTKTEYTIREDAKTISLIHPTVSAQGRAVQEVVVFNRMRVGPGKPQVLGYVLQDPNGNEICRASVHEIDVDPTTGAFLPKRLTLSWKEQKIELQMRLYDTQVNSIDPQRAAKVFNRTDLASIPSVNLAQAADGPNGVAHEMGIEQTRLLAPVK
jgi:hypothetical protein